MILSRMLNSKFDQFGLFYYKQVVTMMLTFCTLLFFTIILSMVSGEKCKTQCRDHFINRINLEKTNNYTFTCNCKWIIVMHLKQLRLGKVSAVMQRYTSNRASERPLEARSCPFKICFFFQISKRLTTLRIPLYKWT